MVSGLLALLDDLLSDFAQRLRLYPHWLGKHRAGVEVRTNAVGQVCATTRAKMRVVAREIGSKFMLPEAFGARATVRNRVADAVMEKKGSLFPAQLAGPSAAEMHDFVAVERDGIVHRDRLLTP